ncbi:MULTISPECIES: sucrose-6-phosphate hydrolase [Vibrionaceae]|uniref:sucrose-6-phosphate hydrolase n=1 Tax=Vibrionaceae TaxID=641 RepID=UPI00080993C1|nr:MULTISPECIES: sucrose-6-phosphate hydrolase [Vibrionaceae]ANS87801.1 Beta-fructofuranosidase [Vibrio scophthalmi]AWK84559.1 sucrose-6-phosphate hydrolase [Photobacterium damselae]MBE8127830.1 sucrose-6-phosphate hydrolase [Photobacterium damselae subsp. piscicida]TLS88833.1 sucrose-6-phosphate hydrolase [Photobacterium damselae subsp. damselae]
MNLNSSWTVEERYCRIEQISNDSIDAMVKQRKQDSGYPSYHIAPKFGLLNDPNGLCYFNGEHHVFYQWTPVGPVHGMKYWYHLSTKDFVHFEDHGIGLHPDQDYDSHGVYSGGALVENDEAILFFTGNHRDENWKRSSTQCFAKMSFAGKIEKHGVVIENEHYTEHFRDPKVWKDGDDYLMVVGAQTQEKLGSMVLYRSRDLMDWQHKGSIQTRYNNFGYMWECPDFFEIDNQAVMLFSPQGVSSDNPYDFKNIYSVAYIVGDRLNLDSMEFENHQDIAQPDYGFDFYAPQTYLDDSGRRILIAWVGLPDIDAPSVAHQWAGMLSLPRELKIQDGYLVQSPLTELNNLQGDAIVIENALELDDASFMVKIALATDEFELKLTNLAGDHLLFSANETAFTLDRSKTSQLYGEEFGCVRKAPRLSVEQTIEMYVDKSVIEIFINGGKHTMTSRFFIDDLSLLSVIGDVHVVYHSMSPIKGLDE